MMLAPFRSPAARRTSGWRGTLAATSICIAALAAVAGATPSVAPLTLSAVTATPSAVPATPSETAATPHAGLAEASVAFRLVEVLETGIELAGPAALGVDHRGLLYVLDGGRHRVIILNEDGSVARELGGYGWADDRLDGPTDLVIDPGIATYVLDAGNRRVVEYDEEGNYLGVALTEEQLGTPAGLELGTAGELYVTDADAQLVRVYSQFGEALDPIGSFGGAGGGLVRPTRVALGPERQIAVADPGMSAVCLYDEFGSLLAHFGDGEGFVPGDVMFDAGGGLLATCESRGAVLLFDAVSGSVAAAVGRGVLGERASPSGLAFDRAGRLLVLDGTTGRVLTFELDGER